MRALLCAAVIGWASVSAADESIFRLDLTTMHEYVAGFPLPIALTLTNTTDYATVNNVTGCSLESPGQAELSFAFVDAHGKSYSVELPEQHGDLYGDSYGPGQSERMLFDVSLIHKPPPPGSYTLRVTLRVHDKRIISNSAPFVVHAPNKEDAAAAARLSQGAPWSDFSGEKAPPPSVHASVAAERQLAMHRFLRRALHAHEKVAEQPLSWLEPLAHGLFAPEAQLYRIEFLVARHDAKAADLARELTAHTPGLQRSVKEALAGDGSLTFERRNQGLEPPAAPQRH